MSCTGPPRTRLAAHVELRGPRPQPHPRIPNVPEPERSPRLSSRPGQVRHARVEPRGQLFPRARARCGGELDVDGLHLRQPLDRADLLPRADVRDVPRLPEPNVRRDLRTIESRRRLIEVMHSLLAP